MQNEKNLSLIEDCMKNMRITNIVQTGNIDMALTRMLSDNGSVIFITNSKFNPFEKSKGITHVLEVYDRYANKFKKKHGILDICIFGHIKHYLDIRATLCAWTPYVRKNGVMVFLNSGDPNSQEIVKNYIDQIDNNYFKVTNIGDLTFIKVL